MTKPQTQIRLHIRTKGVSSVGQSGALQFGVVVVLTMCGTLVTIHKISATECTSRDADDSYVLDDLTKGGE
jgi:hypothetical protein